MHYAQGKQQKQLIKKTSVEDNALIILKQKAKKLSTYEMGIWLADEKLKLERIALHEYEKYGRLTTQKCLYQSKKVDMMLNMIEKD